MPFRHGKLRKTRSVHEALKHASSDSDSKNGCSIPQVWRCIAHKTCIVYMCGREFYLGNNVHRGASSINGTKLSQKGKGLRFFIPMA